MRRSQEKAARAQQIRDSRSGPNKEHCRCPKVTPLRLEDLPRWEEHKHRFEKRAQLLGQGSFGSVYPALEVVDGKQVVLAMKSVLPANGHEVAEFLAECHHLQQVTCANVVAFAHAFAGVP